MWLLWDTSLKAYGEGLYISVYLLDYRGFVRLISNTGIDVQLPSCEVKRPVLRDFQAVKECRARFTAFSAADNRFMYTASANMHVLAVQSSTQ